MTTDMTRVVERICARVVPGVPVRVTPLVQGGARIEPVSQMPESQPWITDHQVMREIQLVGWEVTRDEARLLVLGWSTEHATHRARMLQTALETLQQVAPTVAAAISLTEQHHLAQPEVAIEELAAQVREEVGRSHLRWPSRLAEVNGLSRISRLPYLQRLLTQIEQLEEQVDRICAWHLHAAGEAARAMWHQLAGGVEPVSARATATEQVRLSLVIAQRPAPETKTDDVAQVGTGS